MLCSNPDQLTGSNATMPCTAPPYKWLQAYLASHKRECGMHGGQRGCGMSPLPGLVGGAAESIYSCKQAQSCFRIAVFGTSFILPLCDVGGFADGVQFCPTFPLSYWCASSLERDRTPRVEVTVCRHIEPGAEKDFNACQSSTMLLLLLSATPASVSLSKSAPIARCLGKIRAHRTRNYWPPLCGSLQNVSNPIHLVHRYRCPS